MSTSAASRSPRRTPGFDVLGYTSQARFLLNCGMLELAATVPTSRTTRALRRSCSAEHEMGELFKVIGLARGATFDAIGFASGDRRHTL